MNYDTYVCDTCKKAIDIAVNASGISALPRCKITRNCAGIMNVVSAFFVADEQYHTNVSASTWAPRGQIYDHKQEVPRKTWVVSHYLGASVLIQVMVPDSSGEYVPLYDFTIVNSTDDVTVIEFGTAYRGIAMCTARQTVNLVKATVEVAKPSIPLSINSTIAIATKVSTAQSIELSVQPNPLRPSDIVHLAVTTSPSTQTPWAGASYVIISNQRYWLKFVNISDVLLFHRAAANYFVNLFDEKPVERGETFVLISDDPYTHASDRNLSIAVDLADLSIAKQSNTILTQDALLCTADALSTIYPTMKVA